MKCRHFCFSLDLHNYCPSCREAGKGDDPCVTNEKQCQLCSSFSEQKVKIKKQRRYVQKQNSDLSKDDLNLLGDPDLEEVFLGSHEDSENTAQQLHSSPPRLQHLHLDALSIKTPQHIPPTPGTALQHKIDEIWVHS